jgi:hypothetical protein
MSKNIEIFAKHVRASLPKNLDGSVLDAGSPQYVLPEDQFLDIQSQIFGISRQGSQTGLNPADFGGRWQARATLELVLSRYGEVTDDRLASAVSQLLRGPQSRNQAFPTTLPVVPAVGFYKSLSTKRPNFFRDQFQPALFFADPACYDARIRALKEKLATGSVNEDTVRQTAEALIPIPRDGGVAIDADSFQPLPYKGPLLRNYSTSPDGPLPVFEGFAQSFDTLLSLEPRLPRLIWIRWLNALLRMWLPLVFLRRCEVTSSAGEEVLSAIKQNSAPAHSEISRRLCRERSLLRGSSEVLNQLTPQVQRFIRARFELSVLVQLSNLAEFLAGTGVDLTNPDHRQRAETRLQSYLRVDREGELLQELPAPERDGPLWCSGKPTLLSMPNDTGSGKAPLDKWINWLVDNSAALNTLSSLIGASGTQDLVERVYAYLRPEYEPLKSGFGKNAYEYVAFTLGIAQKKDRDPSYPSDEHNFIQRKGRGRTAKHVSISPGPQLLAIFVQIVSAQAKACNHTSAKLSDLLDLFEMGGIDFRSNPEDFEFLKRTLLSLGLLRSSADAAEAAALSPPYSI